MSVFETKPHAVEEWRRGEEITAARLNRTVRALNELRPGPDTPRQVRVQRRQAGGSAVQQMRLKSVEGDYLVCRTWDGETEGEEDTLVAKPYLLRRTPFDGKTRDEITYTYTTDIERLASKGSGPTLEEETQIVIPKYVTDDIIYATIGVNGGTSVEVDGEPVGALDDNRDARQWARQHDT